jgi:hypothetical protein
MHTHTTKNPEHFNLLIGGAWTVLAMIVLTAVLSITNIIDVHFMMAAVLLGGPPAFVLMLLADKVD